MTARELEQIGSRTFHLSYGEVYVGIVPDFLSAEQTLEVIHAIRE